MKPDPHFPDRPTHPDFDVLSELAIAQDVDMSNPDRDLGDDLGSGVDPNTLFYVADHRMRAAIMVAGGVSRTLLLAIYVDAFTLGAKWAQRAQDSEPKIGDYVETFHHGHRGRVYKIHDTCPEGKFWLAGQSIPIPEEYVDGTWVSILCEPAGSVVAPWPLAKRVEPFPFTNPWAGEHFKDAQ